MRHGAGQINLFIIIITWIKLKNEFILMYKEFSTLDDAVLPSRMASDLHSIFSMNEWMRA